MTPHDTMERAIELIQARTGRKPVVNAKRDTLIVNAGGWIIWLMLRDDQQWDAGAWDIQASHALLQDDRMARAGDREAFDTLLGELRGMGL